MYVQVASPNESLLYKNKIEIQQQMFSIDCKQFVISKENTKVYSNGFKLSNLRTPAVTLTNSRTQFSFPKTSLQYLKSRYTFKAYIEPT